MEEHYSHDYGSRGDYYDPYPLFTLPLAPKPRKNHDWVGWSQINVSPSVGTVGLHCPFGFLEDTSTR